jgi:uncharacterized damage-inducible protein DinB
MSPLQNLIADNVRLLEQGLSLLESLDAPLYGKPEPSVGLSGAGCHFRHLLDFYDRFFEGIEVERIDYDLRQREPDLETDPAKAHAKLTSVIRGLQALDGRELTPALLVKADAEGAAPEDTPWAGSTVERELQVLMSHTVHHYALIAVSLRMNGCDPGPEFGVAPSTLRYWMEQRACAR